MLYAGSKGDTFKGRFSANTKTGFKKWYYENGYVGYLSGYRYDINGTVGVIAFFYEKPFASEIQKRRNNGFKAAKWHWIKED